jgi:hypothetical protein
MSCVPLARAVRASLPILAGIAGFPFGACAQARHPVSQSSAARADSDMTGMTDQAMSMPAGSDMLKHMRLTPTRPATRQDSMRATKVADELRQAIAKYQDTAVAVADGYRMFAPKIKNQRVYHFTNYRHAFAAAFHFDPAKPTSILYERGADGRLRLVGAMYTMPKRASLEALNDRVPLAIAQWHQHVNWCLPPKGQERRLAERRNGAPVFGPESPIDTEAECDAAGGRFFDHLGGWMVHANVYEGRDLATVWTDDHHDSGHGHRM